MSIILFSLLVIIIIIIFIVFFLNKKKETYIKTQYGVEKNLEKEMIENFFIESYEYEHSKNYELINMKNTLDHPLSKDFNKIFHISHIISKSDSIETIKKEVDNIALNKKLSDRILKNIDIAKKFSSDFFKETKVENKIGKIINKLAYEILDELSEKKNNQTIEKFEDDEKKNYILKTLCKKVSDIDIEIKNLKNLLIQNNIEKNLENIKKIAHRAEIKNSTLEKILKYRLEFVYNKIKLEDFEPEYYVDNYNIWENLYNSLFKKDENSNISLKWFITSHNLIGNWRNENIIKNDILYNIQYTSKFIDKFNIEIQNSNITHEIIIKHFIKYISENFENIINLFSIKKLKNKNIITIFYKTIENHIYNDFKNFVKEDKPFFKIFSIFMNLMIKIIYNFIYLNYPNYAIIVCYSLKNCQGYGITNLDIENIQDQEIENKNIIINDWKNHIRKYINICKNINFEEEENDIKNKKEEKIKEEKEIKEKTTKNIENKKEIKNLILKYLIKEFNIKLYPDNQNLDKLSDEILSLV
jgi:hypothetical protein